MCWAAVRFGMSQRAIRQEFSTAALLVHHDYFWWSECCPSPEESLDQIQGDEIGADAIAAMLVMR